MLPGRVVELNKTWCDKFLEHPASCEAFGILEIYIGDIKQESIIYFGLVVPSMHRVDSLRQLGARQLIDATCIDPQVVQLLRECLTTRMFDLGITSLPLETRHIMLYVLLAQFVLVPHIREDRISTIDLAFVLEFDELLSPGIKKPHGTPDSTDVANQSARKFRNQDTASFVPPCTPCRMPPDGAECSADCSFASRQL